MRQMQNLAAWLLIQIVAGAVSAHELEDGFVERTIQVVIRDNVATVKYSVGLSDSTKAEILQHWTRESAAANSGEPAEGATQESAKAATVLTRKFSPTDSSTDPFGDLLLAKLPDAVVVTADETEISVDAVEIERSPRHHFSYIAYLEFELPEQKRIKLQLDDRSFLQFKGAGRYALKSAGRTMISRTSVAPIVVRADRVLLSPDNAEPNNRQIRATVIMATPK